MENHHEVTAQEAMAWYIDQLEKEAMHSFPTIGFRRPRLSIIAQAIKSAFNL